MVVGRFSSRSRLRKKVPVESLPTEASDQRWDEWNLGPVERGNAVHWLSERWQGELLLYKRLRELLPEGGSILEVGAGVGPNLLWLAARGYRAVGVEYRPKVVDSARALASQLELEVEFDVADAFDLSAYRGFDVAFSVGMIEHWQRERAVEALREQAKAARTVVVVVPTIYSCHIVAPTDERFYSFEELRGLLEEAGLARVRRFAYGEVPTLVGRVVSKVLVPPVLLRALQGRTGALAMAYAAYGHSRSAEPRASALAE